MNSILPSSNALTTRTLEGKVALVTGSARGIGKITAETLAHHGAQVCVVSRNEQACVTVAEEIERSGGKAAPFSCDVSDSASVERAIETVLQKFGAVHILVNNAGITRDTLLVRMKDDDWNAVIQTNLSGAFYCSRSVAKAMMKQREGRIINLASIVGIIGNAGQANYAASKAGIIGLTKSMAKELASRGIAVNAVAPGFIETEMTDKLPEKVKAELLGQIPAGAFGTPQDVANVILFLASPLARYITGQVLNVDGGMVM